MMNLPTNAPDRWISFLKKYGPTKTNENQYDEHIRKSAKRLGVTPLTFEHPKRALVLQAFTGPQRNSVILTGTAGDGKTHLCREVWAALHGAEEAWAASDPHLRLRLTNGGGTSSTLHVIRDFSAFAPQRGHAWNPDRKALMATLARVLIDPQLGDDVFLIAANDGQLTEAWHGLLDDIPHARAARAIIEELLVEDRSSKERVPLALYNLSRGASDELMQLALNALLEHPAWANCLARSAGENEFFGPKCPIRVNYERLRDPHTQQRLLDLLKLSDYCGVHIPIRQIWLLLANAILGHPDAPEGLMTADKVSALIAEGKTHDANFYRNLFGGNLAPGRREAHLAFEAFRRFGVGYETSNRIDNLLIFGAEEEVLQPYFETYLTSDPFYGATSHYQRLREEYVDGVEEGSRSSAFLEHMITQRQALFFKITPADVLNLGLWDLTVFHCAGEYLDDLIGGLRTGREPMEVVSRLVRGLNRVFTGHLVNDDQHLFLATDARSTSSRVSRLLEEQISVSFRRGEQVSVRSTDRIPVLEVQLSEDLVETFPLLLPRYEFLVRVADGALPNSFSKEYYEDVLAFKARLLRAVEKRLSSEKAGPAKVIRFDMLKVAENGSVASTQVVVRHK